MNITGIEVIRGNPRRKGIPRSDIERAISHYGITEEEYLSHSEWYPLPERGYGLGVAPPEKLPSLTYGDKLRITTGFNYRGKAVDITLQGSIGQKGGILHPSFDPIITAEAPHRTPDSPDAFVPDTASVDITITADIAPKSGYGLRCEIKDHPDAGAPEVDDVITITGIPPTFKLLEEYISPYAYVYDGPYDGGTITFKTDPFTPANWIAGIIGNHAETEAKKAGGRLLELRIYCDQTPLLWTDWRVEVVTQPPTTTAGTAMSLGIIWWVAFIIVVLGLCALIIVGTWAVKEITGAFTHKPISEAIKATWSRESLISVIGDFEAKLNRTPTPTADLEKKSDDELRAYCDELATAVAPPTPISGVAIAAIGVLVLAALAVGAIAMSRPREAKG